MTKRGTAMRTSCALAWTVIALLAPTASADAPRDLAEPWLEANLAAFVSLYRELHANPELSGAESATAARFADSLARSGYAVERGVGGHGVVGVLANEAGPVVLIRADMDALPVSESTGLAYASRATVVLPDGRSSGVMHACGHDVHMAAALAVARLLSEHRADWSGTLVVIGQPAEETGEGALAMIDAGLFERFPRPDRVLALHVESGLPVGQVGTTPGFAFANVDSVDIVFHGRSGHAARPHEAVDPIVAAAHFVTALQTLVSRRLDPQDAAVVTVGTFHAGTKRNQIPGEAVLELSVRSYGDEVRRTLLDGIRQLAEDSGRLFRSPKPPDVRVRALYTPALYNDPELTALANRVFAERLGADAVVTRRPELGGEDFGRYARELGVPGLLFRVGAQPRERYEASLREGGARLPSLHASDFAPDAEPALATAIRAMSALALELLGPARDPR